MNSTRLSSHRNATAAALAFLLTCGSAFAALPKPDRGGVGDTGPYDYGVMGPPATPAIVAAAAAAITTPLPPGPFEPTWASLAKNYRPPAWFEDAKFGLFMHWGLYSVPAHHNEWYEKHMYGADLAWHTAHYGPPEKFGYKDFIPLFTASKWDPDAWAALFKKSGARLVMPTAQHHDNFALWHSRVTPFNAYAMGPHRDLIGELAAAVRRQGLRFGVSNHGIENFTFVNPSDAELARLRADHADLFDPKWSEFYHVADRSEAAMTRFLTDWVDRNFELIDQYQPDLLWFDNGANLRVLDPLKLRVAAYYYNRAQAWGKAVTLSTKFNAFAPSNRDSEQIGSIVDFEKVGTRSPKGIRPGPWMVDDPIGSTWGYTTGMTVSSPGPLIARLIDTVSKGGFYLLNLSPTADGTLPAAQQTTLLGIGAWLAVNGDAIYGTRPWIKPGEGVLLPARGETYTAHDLHFTTKADTLYAILMAWPAGRAATVGSLVPSVGKITRVELLGHAGPLPFTQDAAGLHVTLPEQRPCDHAYALAIAGLKLKSGSR